MIDLKRVAAERAQQAGGNRWPVARVATPRVREPQKLVLRQITALNQTTAGIIDSTGELLRSNTAQIHEQAARSTIPMETLQRAFQNIYDTMDEVDSFKLRALDSMKQTVTTLSVEVEKSKGYIARAEGQAQAARQVQDSGLLTLEP